MLLGQREHIIALDTGPTFLAPTTIELVSIYLQVTANLRNQCPGFWVENGTIQYPVEEITIAGNLKDMFRGLVAVGNDVDPSGSIRTGSILIESMTLVGS
jgi:predicted Zn-dependent protease